MRDRGRLSCSKCASEVPDAIRRTTGSVYALTSFTGIGRRRNAMPGGIHALSRLVNLKKLTRTEEPGRSKSASVIMVMT